MANTKKAMWAFSGDPIHYGHINIIERASRLFDEIIVALNTNPGKNPLFSRDEKSDMARHCLAHLPNVVVKAYDNKLTVNEAYKEGCVAIVKSVRTGTDLDFEGSLEWVGNTMELGIETILLNARPEFGRISSTMVKGMKIPGGEIHRLVPLYVKQRVEAKLAGQYFIGFTGQSGSGQSFNARRFVEIGNSKGIPVHHIEMDKIGHYIHGEATEKGYLRAREEIAAEFGSSVMNPDGTTNRKALGAIVFNDREKLARLNEIMQKPMLSRFTDLVQDKKGLIILDAALLAESDHGYKCNNNIVLFYVDPAMQKKRLMARDGITPEQVERRLNSQYTFEEKRKAIASAINSDRNGMLWVFDTTPPDDAKRAEILFDNVAEYLHVR